MEYKGKTLRELIQIDEKENKGTEKSCENTIETNVKQKGFDSVEIDNDNGMCMYDYLYNGI